MKRLTLRFCATSRLLIRLLTTRRHGSVTRIVRINDDRVRRRSRALTRGRVIRLRVHVCRCAQPTIEV